MHQCWPYTYRFFWVFYVKTLHIEPFNYAIKSVCFYEQLSTLESGIDVGQGINVGHGKFDKKNKHRALNKRRASKF